MLSGHGYGTVFELTPNGDGSWTESVLHSFYYSDGFGPEVGLIFDAAGNLYGTTLGGGALQRGTVFKLTPNGDGSWTESVLHSFNGSDGNWPRGLIFDAAGNLYGTTYLGGARNVGTVFEFTPNGDGSWTKTVLHSFRGGSDGANPMAGLIFDAAGNLYGTTIWGGGGVCPNGCGTVFKLRPTLSGTWRFGVLHKFMGTPGAYPYAGLVFDHSFLGPVPGQRASIKPYIGSTSRQASADAFPRVALSSTRTEISMALRNTAAPRGNRRRLSL